MSRYLIFFSFTRARSNVLEKYKYCNSYFDSIKDVYYLVEKTYIIGALK